MSCKHSDYFGLFQGLRKYFQGFCIKIVEFLIRLPWLLKLPIDRRGIILTIRYLFGAIRICLFYFFVITILAFTACSDGVSEESLILNDETCAHLISIDLALKLAASFSSDDISTLRASGVKHNKEIKNSFVIQNIDLRRLP